MSLTDDWENGKLKDGDYYVKLTNGDIIIEHLYKGGWCFDYGCHNTIVEVISRCDYDVLAHLETKTEWQSERIKELEQDVKTLTNNYKLLEKQQAVNLSQGQALVDEFGDFEALHEELISLRKEVAKGDEIIGKLLNEGNSVKEENKQLCQLLERGTHLLSFEHEEYEVMSFVSEVNEALK